MGYYFRFQDLETFKLYAIYKTRYVNIFRSYNHRDTLIEATSSQKVWATKVSSGNQGGEPTLGH